MTKNRLTWLRIAALAPLLVALISCGGGGDEDNDISVSIEDPTENSTYTTDSEVLVLAGSASFEASSVSWSNAAGGGGAAAVTPGRSWECVFPPFFPATCTTPDTWTASIPLVVGANVITVTAADSSGNAGHDSITVTRSPPRVVPDATRPTVSSTIPANGAANFAVNYPISAVFSEAMTSASINGATFWLVDGSGNPVAGTVAYAGNGATFTPANSLGYLARYTAVISYAVRDLSGNSMAANYEWSFTTTEASDTTPPTVTSTSPANGVDHVEPENVAVLVTFSEQIDSRSVSSGTFSLKDGSGNPVNGVIRVANGGKSAEFRPSSALGDSMPYTAVVTTGIKDLAGNALAEDYSWTFVTDAQRFGTWQSTSTIGVPSARSANSAAWTGSEMIVWGGSNGYGQYFNTGARYDPATDAWQPMAISAAPSARSYYTAVWTGSELIVWGGYDGSSTLQTGARYNPATDTWQPMTTSGAPSARFRHTAIWTGSEMIVWGGHDMAARGLLDSGARYDPATDRWQPMETSGAPSGRILHTAVWTGSEMIVWGGSNVSTGARYNPVTDTWLATSTNFAPSGRSFHTAVWTGSEMIVWGGGLIDTTYFDSGARYDPATDTWRPTTMSGAPSARDRHTAVWTGSEMLVWAGSKGYDFDNFNVLGARYDATTDTWQAMTAVGAPTPRRDHTAIWTGSKMIVWGGEERNRLSDTGGRFRP